MIVDNKKTMHELFNERIHMNTNLPQAQQFEHVKKTTVIDPQHQYKRTTKKLVKLEIGSCPSCDSTTYCVDYFHGERVCPKCGLVLDNIVFEIGSKYTYIPTLNSKRTYSYKEKQFLRSKNYLYYTEAQEWKKQQISREIDVICSALGVNSKTKKYVREIISKTENMKKLHSKATISTIIAAVTRYVMKNHQRKNIVELRFDRNVFKDTLNRNDYDIVEKNIKKMFGDSYAYKKKANKKKRKRKSKKHSKANSRRK